MTSDHDLLRQFAATRDEACFAELVQRHLGFVYAVCRRRLRDAHGAEDAAQAVFIALARKASAVAAAPSVAGWLHRSACYETNNLMRGQFNRRSREAEAHRLGTISADSSQAFEGLERVLDDVLFELPESDREAILARFFSGKSYGELGALFRSSENAARMRVDRALGKLRDRLQRRGVTSTAAALSGALPGYSAVPVPPGFAPLVTEASLAGLATMAATAGFIGFMSIGKIATALTALAVLGGLAYQFHRASVLEAELATARAESAAATKQVAAIGFEVAEIKRQRATAAAATASVPAAAATAVPPPAAPPPVPGVTPGAPKGWAKNGSATELYEVGVDANQAWGGMPSAYAKSIGQADGKFGGMMQTISADAYRDQRIKLTGWIKTEDAEKGGNLWLRIDGQENGKSLQFDNMNGRAPKGTTEWEEHSIVLDVPPEATRVNYGFFVSGKGKMWVNGITITPVAKDVPTTNMPRKAEPLPKTPVNLGFSSPTPN